MTRCRSVSHFVIWSAAAALSFVGCGSGSDMPGNPGQAGTGGSGQAGTTGTAGTTGVAGTTGTAGTTGAAGSSGAGTTGAAGTTGSAGTTGTAGTTGAAGSSGDGGRGGGVGPGTAGSGGAGAAGTAGAGGAGGSAGASGGRGGTGGRGGGAGAGTAGSGTAGAGGTGTAGAGGSATPGMSAGCGKAPTIPSSMYNNGSTIAITVGTQQRRYILNVPTNYDNTKPYKLIIAWHQLDGNDKQMYANGYYHLKICLRTARSSWRPTGQRMVRPVRGLATATAGADGPTPAIKTSPWAMPSWPRSKRTSASTRTGSSRTVGASGAPCPTSTRARGRSARRPGTSAPSPPILALLKSPPAPARPPSRSPTTQPTEPRITF